MGNLFGVYEAEYIIFDYDPNILLLRQAAENSCVPQSPASKAAAEEVCFVGERREKFLGKHLLFDFSQIKKPCLKLLD